MVLLSVGAPEPVVLAGTGPSVWDLLTDPIDADGLVGLLAEQYAAAVDQVAQDVEWLLGHLESCGVIESYQVDS